MKKRILRMSEAALTTLCALGFFVGFMGLGINFSCELGWWNALCDTKSLHVTSKASKQDSILAKVKDEIEDTGAYEQEVTGKTEFLKGIEYCLSVIEKFSAGN